MPRERLENRRIVLCALLLGWGAALFHLVWILRATPAWRIQFVPDDAFYYLVLAQHYVDQGRWTFDGGTSLTTGYHLLHAYALVAIQALTHARGEALVTLGVLLSSVAAIPGVWVASRMALRASCLVPGLVALLFLLSRNVSLNLVSGMEWGWVVSIAGLYAAAYGRLGATPRLRAPLVLGLLGLLGSLARTDFGLLPAALFAASLPGSRRGAGRPRLRASAAGVLGAAGGVGFIFLHNYWATGQSLQSSAQMKKLWLQTYGPSVTPVAQKAAGLFGGGSWPVLVLSALLTVFAAAAFVQGLKNTRPTAPAAPVSDARLWLGSLGAVAGYLVLYRWNPAGLQHWYTANLIVPMFVVLATPFARMPASAGLSRMAALVAGLLVIGQAQQAWRFRRSPEWPHQASALAAGQFLGSAELDGPVGSWNAGILGFYGGRDVVNLDGLVNNDIYAYAARGALPEYIDHTGIRYLADYEKMLSLADRRARGGYDSEAFLERLEPQRVFDQLESGWRHLTLYSVQPAASRDR